MKLILGIISCTVIIAMMLFIIALIIKKVLNRLHIIRNSLIQFRNDFTNYKIERSKSRQKSDIRVTNIVKQLFRWIKKEVCGMSTFKLLFSLLILTTLLTFILMECKATLIHLEIFRIFEIISLITVLASICFYLIECFKKSTTTEAVVMGVIFFFLLCILTFSVIIVKQINNKAVFIMLVFTVFYSVLLYVLIIKHNKAKLPKIIQMALLYIIEMLFGSIIFGIYFYCFYRGIFETQIERIDALSNPLQVVSEFIKLGLTGFFTYPSESIIDKVTILQYYWGKLLDVGFFAYIVVEIQSWKKNEGITTHKKLTFATTKKQ